MIRSFLTCLDGAFFGIITSIASDQRFGQYPVKAGIDMMAASTSAIFSPSAHVMISKTKARRCSRLCALSFFPALDMVMGRCVSANGIVLM
jgi:hypothetical protein